MLSNSDEILFALDIIIIYKSPVARAVVIH